MATPVAIVTTVVVSVPLANVPLDPVAGAVKVTDVPVVSAMACSDIPAAALS